LIGDFMNERMYWYDWSSQRMPRRDEVRQEVKNSILMTTLDKILQELKDIKEHLGISEEE